MAFSRAVITTTPASTGNVAYTHSDIKRCCACLVVTGYGSSYGAYSANVYHGWGFATNSQYSSDGGAQTARGYASQSGVATSNCAQAISNSHVVKVPGFGGGGLAQQASVVSWSSDGVTFNWDNVATGAQRIIVILFDFQGLEDVYLDSYLISTSAVTRNIGFLPDVSFVMGNSQNGTNNTAIHGGISMGFYGHTVAGGIQQACGAQWGVDNAGSSDLALGGINSNNSIYCRPGWDSLKHRWYISADSSTGYTITPAVTDNSTVRLAVLSFKMHDNQATGMRNGVSSALYDRDATTTNAWSWCPDSVFITGIEMNANGNNTHYTANLGAHFFWYANDAGQQCSLGYRERDAAATTDTGTMGRSARASTMSYVSSSTIFEVIDNGGINLTASSTQWTVPLQTTSGAAYADIRAAQLGVVDNVWKDLYLGGTTLEDLYVGSQQVQRAYLGSTKVFG